MTEIDVTAFFDNAAFTMRMTPGDDPRVSIMDFVMAVTGKNNNDAGEVIRNVQKADQVFFLNCKKYQFSGARQKEQFVLCLSECVELLMMLPGKKAKEFRKDSAGLLTRLFAGDPTLHDVIEKNGLSDGAVNRLARVEVGNTQEEKYRKGMMEVNDGCELAIVKYKHEIDFLNNAIEDRANAILVSTDHASENHALVRTRLLQLSKDQLDMCMKFVDTEEERVELRTTFKRKMTDICNDNVDQHSTKRLLTSRGVVDNDGLIAMEVNHTIAKKAVQQNNIREKEEAKAKKAVNAQYTRDLKAHTRGLKREMKYNARMNL
jgi:hypothetical protein